MKCHYEVLGVDEDVNDQDLKLAYRQQALKWHPDKNIKNQEEATEIFKLVQLAYEVLSDPVERAYYDKNREHILRDGRPPEELDLVNIFEFFTTSSFKGYTDSDTGFFAVYRKVFQDVAAEEDQDLPDFGDSASGYSDVVGPFYAAWESFCTSLEFEWIVVEDPTLLRDRRYLRLCNKENQKRRDAARKERNINIRSLAQFVKKRDPRVKAYLASLQEKQVAHKKYLDEKREQQRLERLKKAEEFQEPEWIPLDELERQLEALEAEHDKAQLDGDEEDSLFCVVCDKLFMSIKSFENHVRSKKHKQNEELVKQQMQEDEEQFQEETSDDGVEDEVEVEGGSGDEAEQLETIESAEEVEAVKPQNDSSNEDELIPTKKPKDKKKNKKKQVFVARLSESDAEAATGFPAPVEDSDSDDHFAKTPKNKDRLKKKASGKKKEATQKESAEKDCAQQKDAEDPASEQREDAPPQPAAAVKLKGHKAREAKRKARKTEDVAPNENKCVTCGAEFTSRNKMFAHFNRTNHAQHLGK